jgi:PIN domain nuclease of toxin-antitoxin system
MTRQVHSVEWPISILNTVLAAARLTELADIFDRLLVAEARALGATLITRDEEITAARVVPVIW